MPTISGGCHCGLVHFEADVPADAEILDCNCSICTMAGYLHLIVHDAKFRLVEGMRDTTTYRFGSGKARHIFCAQCGIKSFFRPRSHLERISINWRCVEDRAGLDPPIRAFGEANGDRVRDALG